MADLPGPPPVQHRLVDQSGLLTPEWARWFVAFYLYVKGL